MPQTFKHPRHTPHLWIAFLATLTLLILYPIENSVGWLSSEATSTLEPTFSLPGGYYDRDIRLKISAPDVGGQGRNGRCNVIFTVDGSVPTSATGVIYTQPILMSADTPAVTTIRARAVLPGGELGPVVSASYIVGVRATLPIMSLIVAPDDLYDPEYGIDANSYERGDAWERPADVTYVDEDRRSGFHVPAGVRIHGGGSRNSAKKSLRLYFRQEYGVSRLEYPLFADGEGAHSSVQSFKRLVLHAGGQDWHTFPLITYVNWTLMRNQLTANLAFRLDGNATHSQPALLFINGKSWGIYQIRERIDRYFLADHYGIESADFLARRSIPSADTCTETDTSDCATYLETPELIKRQAVRMGDSEHWDHLVQFIESHDLSDQANYAYVRSQVDIANFIDYNILQIYVANSDWTRHNVYYEGNVYQFRPRAQGGRWQWMFWDNDHSYGLTQDSRVHANRIGQIPNSFSPETGGRNLFLLGKLLENPVFLNQFLSRAADLLNTTLAPQSVIAHIDALATEMEPDMAYETIRWSSAVNWASNVQALRDFARRRPDFVRQHIVERFGLDGTAQLSFNLPVDGSGYVAVNDSLLPDLPWQGIYFQGIPVRITAAPAPGYRFAGWDPPDLSQTPTITLTVNAARTITPRFEPIGDDALRPGDVTFGSIEKDRFELRVARAGGVDLRGWRVTDNDTKTRTDEGSLIFDNPAFAHIPQDTTILIVVVPTGDAHTLQDDLNARDRTMLLHVGNGNLDAETDPGFNLGPNDNLVLLAPGPTQAFGDDQGIAFVTMLRPVSDRAPAVTPASFGVLADGVLPTH